ncbi:MAG: ABC transporter permease [Acidimicrobiia bacterium]|nr:ABC transporter permease [Acidimicrobiia bacterium]
MSAPITILTRSELRVAARDGEQLLLTAGLPILLLVFFSLVDVLPSGEEDAVDFLVPGVLTVALLSSGFVRLAIALGFDRSFGAIGRYAVSPVRVSDFLGSRALAAAVIAVFQIAVLFAVGAALGWRPSLHPTLPLVVVLALVVFFGLGLTLGSVTDGLRSLALANTIYILLLLVSGVVVALNELPDWLEAASRFLPTTAASELLRATTGGTAGDRSEWVVLMVWVVLSPTLAVRTFRWR